MSGVRRKDVLWVSGCGFRVSRSPAVRFANEFEQHQEENQSVGEADHFHLRKGASDESSPAWPTMRWRPRSGASAATVGLRFDSPEARHARPRLVAAAASQLCNSRAMLSVLALCAPSSVPRQRRP